MIWKFIQTVISIMTEDPSSKMVHITVPGCVDTTPESMTGRMKKILTSPKANRGKGNLSPFKTFGVHLGYLFERDNCEVPHIVRRLCEHLKQHGMHQEGLFRVNGNIKVVDKMKTLFDKNGDANLEEIGDVPACASLLKMFLRELEDPVIPDDLQPLFVNLQHEYCHDKPNLVPRVKQLVQRMPPLNRALLKYLCEFILYISASSEGNRMTPLALAIVFGPNIFRCQDGLEGLRDQAYVNAVFLLILQEFDQIFEMGDNGPEGTLEKSSVHLRNAEKLSKMSNENSLLPVNEIPTLSKQTRSAHLSDQEEDTDSNGSSLQRNRATSGARNSKSPSKSRSPTHSASKQLVENTINVAVKEILFGPGMITSSCESDRADDGANQRKSCPFESCPFEMTEETLNEGLICQTRRTKSCHKNERKNVYDRCMSSPRERVKSEITDEDLEFVGGASAEPLNRLTSSRVKPPPNRRKPSSSRHRYAQKECDNDPIDSIKELRNDATKGFACNQDDKNMYNTNALCTNQVRRTVVSSHEAAPKQILEEGGCDQSTVRNRNKICPTLQQNPAASPKRKISGKAHHKPLETASSPDIRKLPDRCAITSGSSPQRKHAMDNIAPNDMSPESLKNKITSFKNIISNLEASFEETSVRNPNACEKREVVGYMEELGRAKKLLQEISVESCHRDELAPELPPLVHGHSNSSIGQNEGKSSDSRGKEETLSLVMNKLRDKRMESNRPDDIVKMNLNQLKAEKLAVQKGLLMYENQHGRPVSEEDKALMRPLYNHYRKIKRRIATGQPEPFSRQCTNEIELNYGSSSSHLRLCREGSTDEAGRSEISSRISLNYRHNISQSPILLLDPRQCAYEDDDDGGGDVENNAEGSCEKLTFSNSSHDPSKRPNSPSYGASRTSDEAILHDATVEELMEQRRSVKHTKKRLGRLLKNFEEDFFKQYDRRIQKNDRLPKQAEYREYKLAKAKLRLIEALIEKKMASIDEG